MKTRGPFSPLGLLTRIFTGLFGKWSPPQWITALARGGSHLLTKHTIVGVALILGIVGVATAEWLTRSATTTLLAQVAPRPTVKSDPDARDTTKPEPLKVTAKLLTLRVTWDEQAQKPRGTPLVINFDVPAAPAELIGKDAPPDAVKLTPNVPGTWSWRNSRQLAFTPQAGWLPPELYVVTLAKSTLSPVCAPLTEPLPVDATSMTPEFSGASFYIAPATPALQQAVTTITFPQPVTREELVRNLTVKNMSETPLFVPGGVPQVIADEKNPLRFYLRSAPIKPGEKEDIVRFEIAAGLRAASGGVSMAKEVVAKVTSPSRYSAFFFQNPRTQIIRNEDDVPQQFVFIEGSISAENAVVGKVAKAWHLPPPRKNKDAREVPWKVEDITDEVLTESKPAALELVVDEGAPSTAAAFAFRLPPQLPSILYVLFPKETPAPGGFATREDFQAIVNVPILPREVSILGDGGILALTGERKLSLQSRGFEHLRTTLARVPAGQINHLVSQTEGRFEAPNFQGMFDWENIAHFHQSVQDIAKKNDHEANYSTFDFAPALAKAEPTGEDAQRGLFQMEVEGVRPRAADDGEAKEGDRDAQWIPVSADRKGSVSGDSRFVLITDLGLIVKRNAVGTRDVFVQSFQNRTPVAAVAVTVLAKNGDVLAEAATDPQGRASLPALDGLARERQPVAIVARKGADLAFIPWARGDREIELSRFDVGGVATSETNALEAALFTERGIYRPGDPIKVAAIVRQRDWAGSLAGIPVEIVLTNAKEELAGTFPAVLPADGFIELSLPTTETAPTGVWRITLRRPDDGKKKPRDDEEEESDTRHIGHTLVRVEDFQPDRLKLISKLKPGGQAAWLSPKDLAAHAELQTHFGIAAADRRMTAKLRVAPGWPDFEQWPGWRFGLPKHERFEQVELDLPEAATDEKGLASFPLPLEAYTAPLLQVSVNLEGFEADGGRGVRGELSTLVSNQPYLIGSKSDSDLQFLPRDVPRTLQVVAIGPDAKPVVAPNLKRVLVEIRQISILTKQNNGTFAYVSTPREKDIESVDGSLPAAATNLPLPVNRAGRFRYEWRDAAGLILSSVAFNVVGPGDAARNMERDSELELTLPKRDWREGDELEVAIRAPYAGAGLITIEREKVLVAKWFTADTESSVQRITVPAGLEGGAYVSVAFVRALDSTEIFTNPLSVGIAPFRVAPGRREIPLTLEAPERVRPGERLAIGISTPRPTRVIVWAVDEGIHRVTNYQQPQPLADLLPKPALEVSTWQLLDLLIPEYSILKKSRAFGGGDDETPELKSGLNPFKRRRAAPVVYWSGIVECGPNRSEVFYDVPDYFAGRLNIFATSVAGDAIGIASKQTLVKGPFVLTPNTPFFAAPGDEFTASVTVANQLEGANPADQITITAEPTGGIEILEGPRDPYTIAPGREGTARFRIRATQKLGNAELKFTASGGNERVEQRATLSVRPGVPRVASVQSGWFRKGQHDVPVQRDLFAEFAKREAVVSTTPLGLARGLAEYLREYPNGCSEQITSRAFPWLVLRDDVSFGLDKKDADKAVREIIAMLATRQLRDGGFGYWTSEDGLEGFDYVSVYVTHFLTEAKASGIHVPGPMFDAALRRVRLMADAKLVLGNDIDREWARRRMRSEANIQAAAIYLLTRNEEVTTNYALKMRDALDKQLPPASWHSDPSAAWLAATWRLLKKDDDAKKLIAQHIAARAAAPEKFWQHYYYYYESELTREAMTFTVLCRHFPEIAGKFGYDELRPITECIERGDFHTLSAAWTVLALKSYSGLAKETGVKAGISVLENGIAKMLAEPRAGLVSAVFPPGASATRFMLTRPPDAEKLGAWYQAIETGFDRTLPAEAEVQGLEVVREILDANGAAAAATVGDTVLVRVRIRNTGKQPQPNIAVAELLPGGFDFAPQGATNAIAPGLRTVPGADYVDIREDRALFFCGVKPGEELTFEYALRAVCAGTFIVPPTFAESMYDRAVHGRGAAGKFTVLPRE